MPSTTFGQVQLADVRTPALCVDIKAVDANIDVMARARPGASLRPHVKAFKSTALAGRIQDRGGHQSFCCATLREVEGMVAAGLDHDLLLANQTLDAEHLAAVVDSTDRIITVAVDSVTTIELAADAARRSGDLAVLVDVNVGMPRCGCRPEEAGALAASAHEAGLVVRGVMGYEGHVVGNPDRDWRRAQLATSMEGLRRAHADVGGDVISAGGTGTYDLHDWATEVQAGSYVLMDSHYQDLGLPFRRALWVEATVLSVNPDGYAVANAGLKALAMDHGNPSIDEFEVVFCSDEHTTFAYTDIPPSVGDRVRIWPAHVDPTVALHDRFVVIDDATASDPRVVDEWAVNLRGW